MSAKDATLALFEECHFSRMPSGMALFVVTFEYIKDLTLFFGWHSSAWHSSKNAISVFA